VVGQRGHVKRNRRAVGCKRAAKVPPSIYSRARRPSGTPWRFTRYLRYPREASTDCADIVSRSPPPLPFGFGRRESPRPHQATFADRMADAAPGYDFIHGPQVPILPSAIKLPLSNKKSQRAAKYATWTCLYLPRHSAEHLEPTTAQRAPTGQFTPRGSLQDRHTHSVLRFDLASATACNCRRHHSNLARQQRFPPGYARHIATYVCV